MAVGFASGAFAQEDSTKYGSNPGQRNTCIQNLSLYRGYRDQKDYDDAIKFWRKAYTTCPQSAKTLYIDGANFYHYLLGKTKDSTMIHAYVDTLMSLYNNRIQYFGQDGFVLGLKGVDLYQYEPSRAKEANGYLKQSMDKMGNKTDALVLFKFYQTLFDMYKNGQADKGDLLVQYMPVSDILDYNTQHPDSHVDSLRYEQAKNNLDAFFVKIADCDDIYKILGQLIAKNPNDLDLNKKVLAVMNRRDCTDNDLYLKVAEAVYKANPTPNAAYSIGIQKLKSKDFNGALKYFEEAIDRCDSCLNKRQFYYRAGQTASLLGQTTKVRHYANEMLKLNPKDGDAYILIGDAIAASSNACEDGKLGKKAVYWLAVDYYQKAKNVDPKVADEANKKIAAYSKYFPSKKDAFLYGLKDGDKYTLDCFGESTTVRTID